MAEDVVKTKEKKSKKQAVESNNSETEAGILYLSRIPSGMNVKILRDAMSQYGTVERIFLQVDEKAPKRKRFRCFTEGWIEFKDKKVAKRVTASLNTMPVGGRPKNTWFEELWNIKYLPKFKWTHLNERLAYERAVHKQRLRTEISQAKREANFYKENVERNKIMKRKEMKKKGEVGEDADNSEVGGWTFKQKDTEDEILAQRQKRSLDAMKKTRGGRINKKKERVKNKDKKAGLDRNFLKNLFSGGVTSESTDI